jgi:TonB family protein
MNVAVQFKKPEFENNLHDWERSMGVVGCTPGGLNCQGGGPALLLNHNPLNMRKVTMMNHPVWSAAPSFDDLAAAYPRRGEGAEGFAVVHCEVLHSGALTRCTAVKEDPVRHGFADAAEQLVSKFRVSPEVMNYAPQGDPIAVEIPIRFVPPRQLVDRTVTAPAWLAGVDPETTPKLFPPEAAAKGLTTGHGVASCTVRSDGSLAACRAETSNPDGDGFGEAAAKLASKMRMNLWSSDAQPVEGGTVLVAVQLSLAGPK